jgi:hypothetical protein
MKYRQPTKEEERDNTIAIIINGILIVMFIAAVTSPMLGLK